MNDLTRALLADTRNVARDQVERVFEERLAALSAGVVQAVAESLAGVRSELTGKLNQSVRRLRGSETEGQWSKAIVDATQAFSDRAALFLLRDGSLHLAATRNIAAADQMTATPLDSAPAFASAAQSRDTVVALRTKSEMSDAIARWAGEDTARKFYLFPIAAKDRVLALLYADAADHTIETNVLELLATMAGAVIEGRAFAAPAPAGLVQIARPRLTAEEQDLHLKARRFARTQAAEIRLYKSGKVKNGRARRDLYTSLKEEIDSARETFRRDFLSASGTMADYLHLELVRTLANDDVELLGPDYPGPLV
jgi:hypothetical protein